MIRVIAQGRRLRIIEAAEIDIGGVVQLARAVLSERQHKQPKPSKGFARSGMGDLAMLGNRDLERGAGRLIREIGQGARDRHDIEHAAEIGHRHQQGVAVAGLPQGFHASLEITRAPGGSHAFENGLKTRFR